MKKFLLLMVCFLCCMGISWAQVRQVTGRVTNQKSGEPLSGASVMVKGSAEGTTTDTTGSFSISVPANKTVDLVISYSGFQSQTIPLGSTNTIEVAMKVDAAGLEEVVVIGYGTVKKRDLTGTVVSVKSEEIKKVPAGNLLESLQGKIPGADITRTNGMASSGVSILIRGNRSIAATNNPLILVDGIQYPSIQDINANDIQSMEVLKDASSTAIYGVRGANGVILITTRKGTTGRPRVSVNSYYGVSEVSDYPKFMDATQYRDFRREANRRITAAGINPGGSWQSEANDPLIFNSVEMTNLSNGVNTDYIDMLFGSGSQQEHQIGLSAGSDKTKAYLSMDYYNEKGILKLDNLKRYSGRLNLDQTISRIFKAGMQLQFSYYDISNRVDPVDEATKVSSFSTPYDSAGNIIFSPNNEAARWNPLVDEYPTIVVDNNTTIARTLGGAHIEINPFKGFTAKSVFGVIFGNTRTGNFNETNSLLRRGQGALAAYGTNNNTSITWENILTYTRQSENHNFSITGFTSYFSDKTELQNASGRNQVLPSQLYYALGNAPDGVVAQSGYSKYNLVSFGGRINYAFKGKYLATISIRSDGSSKLAEGNKWDAFPAAALAWRISDEGFLQNSNTINDLKLRVSYGVTGSDAIRPYKTQSGLTRIPNSFGDNSALGFSFLDTLGNPDLNWEKTKAFNFGVDFSILGNLISGTIDFYKTNTYDLLLDRLLPPTTGVNRITQNIAETSNMGVDIALNAAIIRKKDLSFNAGITFFSNKERIEELVGGTNDVVNKLFIGSPVSVSFDYRKEGIWQMADSTAALAFSQKPGDIRVADLNNDKKITPDDREVLGQLVPKWNAGLNLDLRFKGIDVNVFFFARQGQMIEYAYNNRVHLAGRENGAVQNYWTPENPSNDFPHPRSTVAGVANLTYGTTLQYVDGSFIKLRTATIGYTLPKSFTSRFGISNLRFYVSGKNLFTISEVDDYDVERGGSLNFPMTKLYLTGLNIEF